MSTRRLRKALNHLNIVLGGLFLTFFIIDRYNPAMMYIESEISKRLLGVFSGVAIATGAVNLVALRQRERQAMFAREREQARERDVG